MAACDACVLLRAPTMGETSGSAIRTLSLGKPLVVSDVGWFAELPDDVALKVPVGGDEEIAALDAALERLADPGDRRAHGRGGARVRRAGARPRPTSPSIYAAALEEAAGDAAPSRRSAPRGRGGRGRRRRRAGAARRRSSSGAALVSPDGRAPTDTSRGRAPGPALLRTLPMWAWLAGALRRRPSTVQLTLGLRVVVAVDHGRRARLLRHGAQLRRARATS